MTLPHTHYNLNLTDPHTVPSAKTPSSPNMALGTSFKEVMIYLHGEVNTEMVTRLNEGLAKVTNKKEIIEISLFSEGGDVYSALAIYSALRHKKNNIVIFAEGLVGSAAVLILAAGDKRIISEHAHICLHKGSSEVEGDVGDLKAEGDQLENLEEQFCYLLSKRTKTEFKEWMSLHKGTIYLPATEAINLGLADELLTEKKVE